MGTNGEASGLNLVFDTNVFLNDNGLEVFKAIRQRQTGTLPQPVRLFVSYVVRQELHGLSQGKLKKRRAQLAYAFLNNLKVNEKTVFFQTKEESKNLKRHFYPAKTGPYGSISDGMILIYSLSLSSTYDDTWLITNDNQLIARSVRSGLASMTLTALKKAMDLQLYDFDDPHEEAFYNIVWSDSDSSDEVESVRTFRDASVQTTPIVYPLRSVVTPIVPARQPETVKRLTGNQRSIGLQAFVPVKRRETGTQTVTRDIPTQTRKTDGDTTVSVESLSNTQIICPQRNEERLYEVKARYPQRSSFLSRLRMFLLSCLRSEVICRIGILWTYTAWRKKLF